MNLKERLIGKPVLVEQITPIKTKPMRQAPVPGYLGMPYSTAEWWVFRIPARLWFIVTVSVAPFKALVMILDGLVALSVLSVLGVVWAWWTQHITDDQVASVIGQIGVRGLSILSKAKIL